MGSRAACRQAHAGASAPGTAAEQAARVYSCHLHSALWVNWPRPLLLLLSSHAPVPSYVLPLRQAVTAGCEAARPDVNAGQPLGRAIKQGRRQEPAAREQGWQQGAGGRIGMKGAEAERRGMGATHELWPISGRPCLAGGAQAGWKPFGVGRSERRDAEAGRLGCGQRQHNVAGARKNNGVGGAGCSRAGSCAGRQVGGRASGTAHTAGYRRRPPPAPRDAGAGACCCYCCRLSAARGQSAGTNYRRRALLGSV